jgi:hypothetical protein
MDETSSRSFFSVMQKPSLKILASFSLILLMGLTFPVNAPELILQTPLGYWKRTEVAIKGYPEDGIYATNRIYFLSESKDKNLNITWQDKTSKNIYITTLSPDLLTSKTVQALVPVKTNLLAAANDENGNFYIVVFTESNEPANDFITLCKVDKAGKLLLQKKPGSPKNVLDIYRIENYAGTMVYSKGTLGLFMGRRMTKSSDGLNHQGGIGVVFDATTLDVITNTGQTSGHSFDNFLTKNSEGDFIGIDLGDNFPRGINMHRMNKDGRDNRLVYTFKTQHGTEANGYGKIYPLYKEISGPKQNYYKWSNDNATYTRLGGVVEVSDGYLVIFAGEPDAAGKSLNNSRTGDNTDARNIGFVKVSKDFYKYDKKDFILSKGIVEKGGFYTFTGGWTEQMNQGVNWLTKYKDKSIESASNVKTHLLPNGNILILWEKQAKTMMMTIEADGKIVQQPFEIGERPALNMRDELLLIGNKVFTVAGKENKLVVSFLELK